MMLRTAALAAIVAIGSVAPDALAQAPYSPKQERVEDFASLVPDGPIPNVAAPAQTLERLTTAVPWGRGMAFVDGELIVLSRGRHRGEGGASPHVIDHAGTLWRIDTTVSEPVIPGAFAGPAVRANATVFAAPTSPPFELYRHDRPAEEDILMDRPYCALAYDADSRNLFICAYSGAELSTGFRKHATDAVHRYDLRDRAWHVVERHDPGVVPREGLGAVISNERYPHHDPAANPPPHGWANGADGCIAVGRYLYVPAKDNHLVVQYDLEAIRRDPDAPPPPSRPVIGDRMIIRRPGGERTMEVLGPGSVAFHDDFLYIGYRTSSVVLRVPVDDEGDIVRRPDGRVAADLIAVFEPWNAETRRSGNLYDIAMSPGGDLFVSMGAEGRVWRITPDPAHPFYGNDRTERPTSGPPFLDMSALVGRKTGCNNIAVGDDGFLYVSTRNNDNGEGEMHGTIYRARIDDGRGGDDRPGEVSWNFDDVKVGEVPRGWKVTETNPSEGPATWGVIADDAAPSGGQAFGVTATKNYGQTFNLAIAEAPAFADFEMTVKARAVSGVEDQGGGPIWRCADANNYYVCRFNPLEGNFRVYVVKDGRRRQLDSAQLPLEAGRWYEIKVIMRGTKMTCFLDGAELLHADDAALAGPGRIGLWTKADVVTSFDDVKIREFAEK